MRKEKPCLHRFQACKCSANCETCETHFCDGGIDDTFLTKLVEQALGDLNMYKKGLCEYSRDNISVDSYFVGTIVPRYFLPKDEDLLVPQHLLLQSAVQSITDGHLRVTSMSELRPFTYLDKDEE